MKIDLQHFQTAHCENGVTTNLLRHNGVSQITEPLAFGIGSGLFFINIPFLKVNNGPAISFRTMPGLIFKRTCESLEIRIVRKKFRSRLSAMQFLDNKLSEGIIVGCQVGVYYLSYFPKEYRFHFNAHNLIVFGKENDQYLISDPVMEYTTTLTSFELERVRFAKGILSPKGQLFYPKVDKEVTNEQIKLAIRKGIKRNVRDMLLIPGYFAGIKGIAYTGNQIKKLREKLGIELAGLYLAQLVRMQEEIGTGGGGFRYIYAAFLQESTKYYNFDELTRLSQQFTNAGDLWRSAAIHAASIYKGRLTTQQDFNIMGDHLLEISEKEKQAFKALSKIRFK